MGNRELRFNGPSGGSPNVGRRRRTFAGGIASASFATPVVEAWPRDREVGCTTATRRRSPTRFLCLQRWLHRNAVCQRTVRLARELPLSARLQHQTECKEEANDRAHGIGSPRFRGGETLLSACARAARLCGEDGGRPSGGFQQRQDTDFWIGISATVEPTHVASKRRTKTRSKRFTARRSRPAARTTASRGIGA